MEALSWTPELLQQTKRCGKSPPLIQNQISDEATVRRTSTEFRRKLQCHKKDKSRKGTKSINTQANANKVSVFGFDEVDIFYHPFREAVGNWSIYDNCQNKPVRMEALPSKF